MSLEWIHESPAHWDRNKAALLGAAPDGAFELGAWREGELIPDEWWRVEQDGAVLGYGWMDCTWGDAEILLAVDPASRGRGVGTFILDHLELEAAAQGLNYLYNVVRPAHREREAVTRWLVERGFVPSSDGLLRRRVAHPTSSA